MFSIVRLVGGAHGGNWMTVAKDIMTKDLAIEKAAYMVGQRRQVVEMPSRTIVAEWGYRTKDGKTILTRIK